MLFDVSYPKGDHSAPKTKMNTVMFFALAEGEPHVAPAKLVHLVEEGICMEASHNNLTPRQLMKVCNQVAVLNALDKAATKH
jgi:hypothetical protein